MAVREGQRHRVRVDNCTVEGDGVARIDGMAVFVHGALRGELADIVIEHVGHSAAWAGVERIVEPSPARLTPDCPYYASCGGCRFRHASYAEELEVKRQRVEDALKRIGEVDITVDAIHGAASPDRYRNKAQFPVAQGPKVGFYRPRTHHVVDIKDCLLQPVQCTALAEALRRWMADRSIPAYDEKRRTGLVRHLYVRTDRAGEALCCLVVNAPAGQALPFEEELVSALRAAVPSLVGAVLNYNPARTNVVLGRDFRALWGRDWLEDGLCGLTFRISPRSFYQVNRVQCEVLYGLAAEFAGLAGTETVLDLYCGIGTISLVMARRAGKVIGVEVVPEAVEDAKENARRNGIDNAEFWCGDASDAAKRLLDEGLKPDVVIVDPPRKGLAEEVVDTVAAMGPDRVVYVSCDPATLARDVKRFGALGYGVQRAEAVDMFPRTGHVETVCLLSKLNVKQHIEVELTMDEMDLTAAEKKASYEEIKEYVLEKFGMKVSHLYIAQVKRKCGIIERENYNKPKSEDSRQPQCPPEKEAAIRTALEHFGMI